MVKENVVLVIKIKNTKKVIDMRKLGKHQKEVLNIMIEKGEWYPICGWIYDTHYNTHKILNSLVKYGYVKIDNITLSDGTIYHGAYIINNETN